MSSLLQKGKKMKEIPHISEWYLANALEYTNLYAERKDLKETHKAYKVNASRLNPGQVIALLGSLQLHHPFC